MVLKYAIKHRSLAEEDLNGGPGNVAQIAGPSDLYREGDAAKSPSLAAYLSTKVRRKNAL